MPSGRIKTYLCLSRYVYEKCFEWIPDPAHPASLKLGGTSHLTGFHRSCALERHVNITSASSLSHPRLTHGCWRVPRQSLSSPNVNWGSAWQKFADKLAAFGLNSVYPMHSCTCTQEILCLSVWYLWQRSTWPHLILVLWQQAVIIFIFCCCSLHPSLYTVDQYVIPLLLLQFGTDNVLEDKPAWA